MFADRTSVAHNERGDTGDPATEVGRWDGGGSCGNRADGQEEPRRKPLKRLPEGRPRLTAESQRRVRRQQ